MAWLLAFLARPSVASSGTRASLSRSVASNATPLEPCPFRARNPLAATPLAQRQYSEHSDAIRRLGSHFRKKTVSLAERKEGRKKEIPRLAPRKSVLVYSPTKTKSNFVRQSVTVKQRVTLTTMKVPGCVGDRSTSL